MPNFEDSSSVSVNRKRETNRETLFKKYCERERQRERERERECVCVWVCVCVCERERERERVKGSQHKLSKCLRKKVAVENGRIIIKILLIESQCE